MATDVSFNRDTERFASERGDVATVSGAAEIVNRVNRRLRTLRGEIPYDTSIGVDWFGIMFSLDAPINVRENEIKREIQAVAGIQSVTSLLIQIDPVERLSVIEYSANTPFGEIEETVEVVITSGN